MSEQEKLREELVSHIIAKNLTVTEWERLLTIIDIGLARMFNTAKEDTAA